MVDLERGDCPNDGCYYSDTPEGMNMCIECTKALASNMSSEQTYEMYTNALEYFKSDRQFRRHIRENDPEMTGDYEGDLEIFDKKMFEITNALLLEKI